MADLEEDELLDAATSNGNIAESPAQLEPTVTTVEVDLFLSLQDPAQADTSAIDQVFAAAVQGLVGAMLLGVHASESQVHMDGNLTFRKDREPSALPIDRHGSYLVHKRAKERASNGLGQVLKNSSLYGNSRNPSRVSSRAHSRVSGALTSSVLAMKMAKLVFKYPALGIGTSVNGDQQPFRINEWNEAGGGGGTSTSGDIQVPSKIGLSSRFSLASRGTARTQTPQYRVVDYQEMQRRELLSRDIETRDQHDQMTARIQRMGKVKLKLRSMADPSISLDKEERLDKQEAGKSRAHGGISKSPVTRAPPLTRVQSIVGSVDLSVVSSRSFEPTYRPEDYEGLDSELVMLDKRGELLVGENLQLVTRKLRHEMELDMFQKNTIKPRVHFPVAETTETEATHPGATANPALEENGEPRTTASRKSPQRATNASLNLAEPVPKNPVFEGIEGTFQSYPRMELDPKKTPLAKGVTIPVPIAGVAGQLASPGLKPVVEPPTQHHKKHKHTSNKTAAADPQGVVSPLKLSEDAANDLLEPALHKRMQSSTASMAKTKQSSYQQPPTGGGQAEPCASPSARTTARTTARSPGKNALAGLMRVPRKNNPSDKQQLQSLRLRTPAYGNRNALSGLQQLESYGDADDDDDDAYTVDTTASLQSPANHNKSVSSTAANLPKFGSYIREFPSPPKGQIHVVSSHAAASILGASSSPAKATSGFPFAMLPNVVRNSKRS